jgi:hypothetical protein
MKTQLLITVEHPDEYPATQFIDIAIKSMLQDINSVCGDGWSVTCTDINHNTERCDWCSAPTDNGAGHYQDELGTEDRICTECFTQKKGLK